MQVAVSDKQLHLDLSHSPSATPSATPLITPSFSPNSPGLGAQDRTHSPSAKAPTPTGATQPNPDAEAELELDYSQPVSTLLRLGTQRAHVKAEHSEGAAALVQGVLPLEEYIRWLAILWRVYDALELGLSEHASNPVLAPTYDPALLERAPALAADIVHLLTLLPASSTSSSASSFSPASLLTPLPPFPLPPFLESTFINPPSALTQYLSHIRSLSLSSSTAPRLLAHAYVRYLGDLSGGQFIGAKVRRSYHLSGDDGTKFYAFDFAKGRTAGVNVDQNESRADAKRRLGEVKDWYRRGMDEGVAEDRQLKVDLVEEANIAFVLNTNLFSVIQVPPKTLTTDTPASQGPTTKSLTPANPAKAGAGRTETLIWFVLAAGFGYLLNVFLEPTVRRLFGSSS